MLTLFQVCFGVGLGYAILSFLLGHVFDVVDLGFDMDVDAGSSIFTPFKPVIIAMFLIVFGGVGMIFFQSLPLYFTFLLAGSLGLIGAFIMYRFVYLPLIKAQNTSAVEKQSLVGHTAKVSEYIPQGKYGKITYYVNGNTYSAPAKSEDGMEVERGANVEIVSIVKNTFYVKKKEF